MTQMEAVKRLWETRLRVCLAALVNPRQGALQDRLLLLKELEAMGVSPKLALLASNLSPQRWWKKVERLLPEYLEARQNPPLVVDSNWAAPWCKAMDQLKALGVDPNVLLQTAEATASA